MSIFSDLGVREGADRNKEEILYNLAACYSMAERRVAQFLAPHGLSPVKMNALLLLRHLGKTDGISQGDIGKKMIVSAGNITRLVDRMAREKLVERISRKGDRRVKWVRITARAEKLLDEVWPPYKKEVERIVSLMPALDMAAASVVLNGFREKLSAECQGGTK